MSKQLAKKFLWMRGCIADSFGLKEDYVSDAIFGNQANRTKIDQFLETEGPPKIMVYYQTPDTGSQNDHNVIDPQLFLTYGDSERIKDKAVWFLRNLPQNKKKININEGSNEQVLFGQVTPNPVRVLNYMIEYIYDPLLNGEKHDWGQTDHESKKEFVVQTEKFKKEVREALKLMEPGQEHFKIRPEQLQRLQGMTESQRIQRFEEKFDQWIKTIERFLSTEPEAKNEGLQPGPKTELQFWKERMQTITNWSQQLKNKDFNMVKMALIKYKQNEGKKQGQQNINKLMLSFQRLDLALTDKLNEAKDNVKYLSTLEKFIEPLYTGTPQQIIETLPSLMNAIKMIHTIARFYNTSDKMTGLFIKITNQMIKNCREKIIPPGTKIEDVWKRDPAEVIEVLGSCIKLNREYKQAYKATKEKVADMPKGKTFDFSETQIFNKFDQFVKRLQKLIEVFSNIQQFDALAKLNLQKMDVIINKFNNIRDQFKAKRKSDLLDLTHSNFDKEYVSFNISISQLDTELQQFIDDNFSKSKSIEQSINLLKKFENTIKRDALKHNLTSKYNTILTNYASQLEVIQRVFNDQKSDPPIVRNMPENAGKIIWSKHLYQKIAGPITKFPQNVIHSSQIKKYYGNYNTLGKMLTINEMWYYDLWVKQIERSKAALQATLIVRHQTQKKLYVNFDVDIMQLIRQAKCLDRQGIPIPESARIILLQEEKFKMYYNELLYVLKEYERIISKIKPICKNLLAPHIADMQLKLHPGMSTLTWTSMNIDSYLNHVHQGLNKLEQLIINVNDIIENRIENNLKNISKVSLVSLPHESVTFTLETFVSTQEEYINEKRNYLTSKNLEIERSVDDLLLIIINYQLDPRIDAVKSEEVKRIKKYYFFYMYNALLNATQNSLNSMKHRVCGSSKAGSNTKLSPFFEVDVQLSGSQVQLNPSLEEIQKAINKAATAVLRCSKTLYNWDQHSTEDDKKQSLYQMIAQDKEIVKVILLLTGSIQGTKNKINEFISKFSKFQWLWQKSISKSIKEFSKGSEKPQLSAYESEFKKFSTTEEEIQKIEPTFIIGAMQLKTNSLIVGLKQYTKQWKNQYAEDLHKKAKSQLYRLSDHISELIDKLSKTVVKDIDSLGIVMEKLEQIRSFQAVIDISFNPVTEMYALLDANLPGGITDKDQSDARIYLWSKWSTLIDLSEKIGRNLAVEQTQYLRTLKKDIKILVKDISDFRGDYEKNGPMVEGIIPKEAIERLKRFDEQYEVRQHQFKINFKGEELFGLQHQKYPALQKTKAELLNLKKLYNLYSQVIREINSFQQMLWVQVNVEKINAMQEASKKYSDQCIRLPKDLKEWQAYKQLKTSIQNLKALLPVITILKKDAVKDRHWQALNQKTMQNTHHRIPYDQPQVFTIEDLVKAKVLDLIEDIQQIGESAEKQKKIELNLSEITEYWSTKEFQFGNWGKRENIILGGLRVAQITQKLQEDQMILSSTNAQRHVTPFKKQVEQLIRRFSDTSQILDLWIKVQTLWRSLQPVFTGGDIAKQLPLQAKAFAGIDKTWMRCMQKSFQTKKVLQCCELDLLKDNLPDMQKKLEECQKLLEAYLEGKRKLFPRFYFVSNPDLLKILSQGSQPTSIQEDFEKLFDAITKVEFGKSDKKGSSDKTITTIIQEAGGSQKVPLVTHVKCQGNIQSWLKSLQKEMQDTMREHCRNASAAVMTQPLQAFVKSTLSQVSLMGIQLLWTHKITEALQKGQKQNKGAMQSKKKQIEKMLQELTNLCLQPIQTSLERTKIQTLVTVHVHQRDITVEMKCQNTFDFDWQKQTRLYWRSEQDTCMISITDWEQSYSYEFLGAKERLCITPLTDRCYITLAQAMSMFYGGAPAGPAGTGKTETVKDLGRGLGVFVVVTNCSDQHRYRDMAKIFKGLVQSGLWGCFDEFNRIELQVLSVVAMQVQSIGIAKKQHVPKFMFPEEQYPIDIIHSVGYFITMNPGYAGRQELPENLKVLFRGVTMMMPDREIIIKVKLASVGYQFINVLAKKFNMLYKLCQEQLSKQRHYDFGLRNILSVLRTAGNTKRKQTKPDMVFTPEKKEFFEEFLLMRSLRDMNMSKLVFDDIPLFEGLLKDIFPRQTSADKVNHAQVESRIPEIIKKRPELINRPEFSLKIIQVYETSEVRHGFMLLGLSITGKTTILSILTEVLSEVPGRLTYRIVKMNPKAITDKEMYGVKSQISDDWIPGVFSTLWQKCNSRSSKFNIWLTCDGPVDAIWIENLNTVLDDNKILTLANGERIPMTDQCKLVFEVENLNNASPATVSRCGQIYISPNDLGTTAIYEGWCQLRALERSVDQVNILKKLIKKYFEDIKIVQTLEKTIKNPPMMDVSLAMKIMNTLSLINGLLKTVPAGTKLSDLDYEKLIVYSVSWAVGGLYEAAERFQFHQFLQSKNAPLPQNKKENETIFDYYVLIQDQKVEYTLVKPEVWKPAADKAFKFSQLLLPTIDSFRVEFLVNNVLTQPRPTHSSTAFVQNGVLLIGGSGTAKTSSVLMWAQKFDLAVQLFKRINFSSATSPGLFQASIQQECDNKIGKEYGPPQNKLLAIFIDDLSMPFVNKWGDQVTLQIVRQLMEQGGFYWLDKAQRGNFKSIKNLSYVGAMNHPGGGRNDIPNRLKRQFFIFNMILPLSIEGIYGPIVRFQFRLDTKNHGFTDQVKKVIENLTSATIKLWQFVKKFMLPTPSKFHYLFNMRQLSRTFKGILQIKKQSIMRTQKVKDFKPELYAIGLWRYECERVFCDKLVNNKDKDTVLNAINDISIESFGMQAEINQKFARDKFFSFADFLTPDEKDQEGIIIQLGPRNYEAVSQVQILRKRAYECMQDFNAQPKNTKKLELVLFNDALKHLLKIIRIIRQPRSSALLVGVGGSGKQSLTRLASFIQRMQYKQIQLVKNYAEKDLKQDIKKYFEITGRFGKNCCFILTDSQIKKEEFLQFVSMILSTGQIPGLLAKDQKETFLGDARNDYVKQFKGADPAPSQLYSYFIDRIRDNLHVCLCFSPVGQKFRDRFRKFPALFNECTIDWFLPWPEEALISVAESFIEKFKELDTEKDTKVQLMKHMGNVHYLVTNICGVYFQRMRRQVYFTPKSYLSYLAAYKKLYTIKYKELDVQESNFKIGVKKINQASEAIAGMKVILSQEELKLKDASDKTEKMLRDLEVEQRAAQKIEAQVNAVAQKCQRQAIAIDQQKTEAERQLAAAIPAQARAQAAVDSLDAASVNEMKANKKPQEILKLVLDAIAIYFNLKLSNIILIPDLQVAKGINIAFWKNSYEESGKFILGPQFDFLKNLKTYDKDAISNETIQLLEPLLVTGTEWFNEVTCGKVSKAIAAICKWLFAVFQYHEKSQIVKPKKIKLAQEQANLQIAQQKLAKAREELRIITEKLNRLKEDSQKQLDIKNELESQAQKTKKKITTAETLINSLSGERARWKKGANEISDEKKKLVGNCSLATAFISYCGPFNAEFRQILAIQKFTNDMKQKDIPHLPTLAYELTSFLVDQATVGQWNLQGLPKDSLSIQNGIMVTRSDRFPLLIDPQGQGQAWILRKYAQEMQKGRSICALTHPKFKDWFLKYCLENGKALLIEGIENEVDPILDPVLQKQIIWRKNRGTIKIAGGDMDYDKNFKMFLTCRLPNPSFSPQLSAKTTVIDFTVTQGGLQQQLLGKVISHEQKSLQDSLNTLLNDVNANKKALQKLDKDLLQRLTQSQGNLLDDTSLMEVLNNTKTQAKEVAIKLEDAEIKTKEINEKREQYRPVAIRGSALYFTLIELFLVNWMYNSSLEQFLQLFNYSLAQKSPQANSPQKRVDFIIKVMTRHVHKYANRGLFEKDKITFLLMVCFKILITAKKLTGADVGAFLKAGAGQDIKTARQKPQGNQFNFIEQKSWLNVIAFSKHTFGESSIPNFKQLPDLIPKNQPSWLQYFEKNDPENYPIPDLAERMSQQKQEMRAFMQMFLVRSVREDRTLVASSKFIAAILGQQFINPISYPMQDIWAESKYNVPVLFLLSPGADPTSAIDDFARKKKKTTEKVSMGQGQEEPARRAIKACMQSGGWVILQNCQLGLKFMEQTEQLIITLNNPETQKPHEDFRLWITCQPHNRFPLGLLQKVIKVTNEPPKGLKAGLNKTFTTMINQQFLQKVDNPSWKNLIFTICYLHSVVIERRKFGSLGWCVPYEFNNSDLEASLCFVEKYLNNLAVTGPQQQTQMQQINTTVLKYMVCEVLYGGRITDDLDRELFATFGEQYIKDGILNSGEYVFFGNESKDKNAFKYKMPANPALQISKYHEYINSIPAVDSPQVFGLDSNADLTFRMKESIDMITTIMQTRPKEASAGGGKTRQEIVKEKSLDLLSKMPLDYNENEVRQLIKKLSGPKALGAVGYAVPLNIFLSQEIARMQVIFNIVRKTLVDACDAIDGQIIMTAEIMDSINAIFDARVPNQWVYDATGAQISWIIPTLAKWFNDLIQRNKQLYQWMKGSRPYTFWLGGFFNPQGFLTAMKQEVTRMHKTPKQLGGGVVQPPWSLDDVAYQTTVKEKDQDLIREGRDKDNEGVYIRQLMLQGARWHKNSLQASRPKEMFAMLPLLHVTAINKKKSGDDKSVYNCPVYKYAKRTDRYLVFKVTLNTESEAPSKWKLKGVALLCARD